jgi:hypothetical protein
MDDLNDAFELFGDIELWHLTEEVSIDQAALLLLKLNPSDHPNVAHKTNKPGGYDAISTALMNAIASDRLVAKKAFYESNDFDSINPYRTIIKVDDLCAWLKQRNFTDNFFFQNLLKLKYYLDPNHEFYAPKLHALIEASEAVTANPSLLEGKTPKQAIDKWLRQNAGRFALTDDDGNPNNSAIEEMSKIGNWKPEGGASKTPTGKTKVVPGKLATHPQPSKNIPTHQ